MFFEGTEVWRDLPWSPSLRFPRFFSSFLTLDCSIYWHILSSSRWWLSFADSAYILHSVCSDFSFCVASLVFLPISAFLWCFYCFFIFDAGSTTFFCTLSSIFSSFFSFFFSPFSKFFFRDVSSFLLSDLLSSFLIYCFIISFFLFFWLLDFYRSLDRERSRKCYFFFFLSLSLFFFFAYEWSTLLLCRSRLLLLFFCFDFGSLSLFFLLFFDSSLSFLCFFLSFRDFYRLLRELPEERESLLYELSL